MSDIPYVVIENVVLEIEPGGTAATAVVDVSDYVHTANISSASDTWTINHNLGRKVNVAVYTVGGVEVEAEVILVSDNQAVAQFSAPATGYARVI